MIGYIIAAVVVIYLLIGSIALDTANGNGDKIEGFKNKAKYIVAYPFVYLGWVNPYGDD